MTSVLLLGDLFTHAHTHTRVSGALPRPFLLALCCSPSRAFAGWEFWFHLDGSETTRSSRGYCGAALSTSCLFCFYTVHQWCMNKLYSSFITLRAAAAPYVPHGRNFSLLAVTLRRITGATMLPEARGSGWEVHWSYGGLVSPWSQVPHACLSSLWHTPFPLRHTHTFPPHLLALRLRAHAAFTATHFATRTPRHHILLHAARTPPTTPTAYSLPPHRRYPFSPPRATHLCPFGCRRTVHLRAVPTTCPILLPLCHLHLPRITVPVCACAHCVLHASCSLRWRWRDVCLNQVSLCLPTCLCHWVSLRRV